MKIQIDIDRDKIVEFCRKWKIIELSLFGSVLRDDFKPDSDVDVLVRYAKSAHRSLTNEIAMEEELSQIIGRKADLVERKAVEQNPNYIRRKHILNSAERYYVA